MNDPTVDAVSGDPNREYDAEIRDAIIVYTFSDEFILIGRIYGDTRKRFGDGTSMRTTNVLAYLGNGIFQTLRSRYKVSFFNAINWEEHNEKAFKERFHYDR